MDPEHGEALLSDFAPGETARFRKEWRTNGRLLAFAMALGPLSGGWVLINPDARPWFVVPVVALYDVFLLRLYLRNRRLLADYRGWDLLESGLLFPLRRNRETRRLERRFLPFDQVDAIYFEGTSRLVSLVWPDLPADVRAEYGREAPRALDRYVVIVDRDGGSTAIKKEDVADVEALKGALEGRIKVVG